MSEIEEAENISDVNNTRNAVHKIQLKILKILDKCQVETRVMFGDEGQSAITITFLERERKHTGGGRGSHKRRRRRRQQQSIISRRSNKIPAPHTRPEF